MGLDQKNTRGREVIMLQRFRRRAALLACTVISLSSPALHAQEAVTIDPSTWSGCIGQTSCQIGNATVTSSGGALAERATNGAVGLGIAGGPSGGEIDIGETLSIRFPTAREVTALKILFLYNGPEFDDLAEVARITANGQAFTLAVGDDADDAGATWNGAGTVEKCGTTTASGTGCFLITNPFPSAVTEVTLTAMPGTKPFGGGGTNNSDFALGFMDVAGGFAIDLRDCAGAEGCVIAKVDGEVAATLNSVKLADPEGPSGVTVFRVRLPDCRYLPQLCRQLLLPKAPKVAAPAARNYLIRIGVIQPFEPDGPSRSKPSAQRLNVTPLLPDEIRSLFDASGDPPNGLPPLLISARWRAQAANGFFFDAFFFKAEQGVAFRDTFGGEIDVSKLTGRELGCFAVPGELLEWDVITAVSETYRSIGGNHIDTITNVGCRNPTKIAGTRLSLYPVNLEITPDTFAPTIKSAKPKLTVANDAVFARLVQSLWDDVAASRRELACVNVDPTPGAPAIAEADCQALAATWALADHKIDECVAAAFKPRTDAATATCNLARQLVMQYEAQLPETPAGPDVANRLGEQKARVETWLHIWDTRYIPSIKPTGFCAERKKCAP
jgi:hypothetical protein